MNGSAPPSSRTVLLEVSARNRCHGSPGGLAPGQRHGGYPAVGDDRIPPAMTDRAASGNTAGGSAGAMHQVLERHRALRNVRRVLQQADVPGRQRRARGSE
jgi:hypothetical protein